MPKPAIAEITKRSIKRAYRAKEGTQAQLAERFKVSVATVRRVLAEPDVEMAIAKEAIDTAIAGGATVQIDGMDVTQFLTTNIKDLATDMKTARPATREGMASAVLRWVQYLVDLNPPTLEQAIEALLDRSDFDPQVLRDTLRKHAQKAG
jgi:transcriptional regulator with XRE-family HTH domain